MVKPPFYFWFIFIPLYMRQRFESHVFLRILIGLYGGGVLFLFLLVFIFGLSTNFVFIVFKCHIISYPYHIQFQILALACVFLLFYFFLIS